jgi:protein-disulfide isomerase
MKRIQLATLVALVPLCASAQFTATTESLRAYAVKALPRCQAQTVTIERLNRNEGPVGFAPYGVVQTSSDKSCGKKTFFFYSPTSQQILMGPLFPLPADIRPVTARVAEVASQALEQRVDVTVAPFTLQDGLRVVSMVKPTKYGPFSYHGYLDASQRWMVVGWRGNLKIDPAQTLMESLPMSAAVRRGNPKAKVKIIELSDFECPTCARAHKKVEPIIAKNLAKVDYYRLDLPLFEHHEWAFDAALGARAIARVAPAKYWSWVNFVFVNQDAIVDGKQPIEKVLHEFCDDHDISWTVVEKVVKSPAERGELLDQVSRAFDIGVNSTPTYIVNGQIMGFGPEGTFTVAEIKKAIGVK